MEDKNLQKRDALIAAIRQHLADQPGTQATKARNLSISQPRLSDLMRGKTDKFSLDALVLLSQRAGLRLNVNAQSVRLPRGGGPRIVKRSVGSPFPVNPSELGRFDMNEAPKLLLTVLRCEVFAVGLSPKDVVLSHATTSADGGIDAKVTGTPSSGGLMVRGSTYFQIKTGASFKPWHKSSLKKELFGRSSARPSRNALGRAVRECLDDDGVYCLVTFGHDLLPIQHGSSVRALTELFQASGYSNPRVAVIGQGQLAGEIERYPSIYLDLFGFEDDLFLSLRAWRASPSMRQALALGSDQQLFIEEVRKTCIDGTAAHIRVVGEPGIGKTRLLLEALSNDTLAPSVIYVPTGEDFQRSRLFKEVIRSERSYALTLVIDDCDERDRVSIWGALRGVPSIKLITVDHGFERGTDSAMRVLQCPRLPSEQIEEILKQYIGARPDDARKWAEICDGSPRVAHAVGENLRENPGDILRPPSSVPLWDRYITGYSKASDVLADQYKLVLRHIALFTRFGFETPVSEEGQFVSTLVSEADPLITYAKFQEIVQHFRGRRILQGRHTLFLVPKALHIYLWVDFWNHHGRGFDFVKFFERVPQGMQDWFLRLFTYAHDPAPARAVVRAIVGPNGPFMSPDFANSEVAARLLRYLAEADAAATLACIERTHGQRSHAALLAWRTGRQDIVWALEKIAVWDYYFERAVRILAKMAVAENAKNSNNSTGTLIDLFSIGPGWAPTQAPPTKRFPILSEFVRSRDESIRELGLALAKSWLSTRGGSRMVGAEHQGLRLALEFWRPKTYGEVFEAWRQVWTLLATELAGAEGHWRARIAETLIDAAEGLIPINTLASHVLDTLFDLARTDYVNKRSLVALIIRFLRWRQEKLPDETLARIRELDVLLTGSSLWDRICRHVLNSNWDEDYTVENEAVIEPDEPKTFVEQLSRELMSDPGTLAAFANQLMRASGHRLTHLGVACGRLAIVSSWDAVLLNEVNRHPQDFNGEFLGGYFEGIRELDSGRWEKNLLYILIGRIL